MLELSDRTWRVADAGRVTFAVERDRLALRDVESSEGWTSEVVEVADDRLALRFRRGGDIAWMRVRYAGDVLRVGIESGRVSASLGRYTVGDAGEVEVAVDGGQLCLVEVATNPGWAMSVDEQCLHGVVDVDFRRDLWEWEFEAGLSRDGRLDVDLEMTLEGPFPS